MKLVSPSLAALAVALLAAPPALAMDQRQADAACAAWTLECPKGATVPGGLPKKTGALECKKAGAKEGPAVVCKEKKAESWGDWKAGKKHGLQVTLRPNGSWTEELFTDGKPNGRTVEYSADGQLLKETHFQAGKKHGPERTFKTDGQLATEEFWDKGAKSKKPVPAATTARTAEPPSEAKSKPAAKAKADKGAAESEEGGSSEQAPAPAEESQPAEAEAPAAQEESQAETPQP
ncbi:toxin-antitoxin system YwqK family antitoxin [Hyalangium gracile]|uniref:toxin-antitoxin system YwqK family antitoxin n=1 Tax=Hyalangium gracile TaxID=394092 RepID=UPI001CCF22B1|nr:hypothetical protein [Hyalangium gracile]